MSTSSRIIAVSHHNSSLIQLKKILSKENYVITVQPDPRLAYGEIVKSLPDLILMEAWMPEIDGYSLLKQLKDNEQTKAIPVIFCGLKKSRPEIIKAYQQGISDYLTKPFVKEELLSRIRLHLQVDKSVVSSESSQQLYHKSWETILANYHDAIVLIDNNHSIQKANKATYDLLNQPQKNIIGSKCYKVFFGKKCSDHECPYQKVLQSKNREEHIKKIGDKWLKITIDPILNDQQEMVGAIEVISDFNEAKKVEEKLSRSERELLKVQEITHIGSWYLDIENNEVTWTEELYRMYGFDPSLPPPPYTEHMKLFTPESWKLLSTSLDETSKTGIPYELELNTVRNDGSLGWMWVRGEALKNKQDKIVALWGAAQDITERKKVELLLQQKNEEISAQNEEFMQMNEELDQTNRELYASKIHAEENEILYHTVVSNTPTVSFVLDPKGNFTLSEGRGLDRLGLKPGQVVGLSALELYKDYPLLIADLKKALKGESFHSETVVGKNIFDISYTPLFDQDNKLTEVLGVANDITEEKEYIESIKKLSTALEQSPLSIVITDIKGTIEYVNPFFSKITGYQLTEAIGKNTRILQSGKTAESTYKDLWKTITKGEIWQGEFINQKKNGELYWESASISPILNDKGKITNYIAIKEDITDRKELLNQLLGAKENAERNEKLFRTLFTSMQEGFYLHELIYDKNGNPVDYKIIEANKASETHLGIKTTEAVGKLATELYNLPEAPFLKIYAEVAESGKPVTMEEFFEPMDKYFHISVFSPQKGLFATVFLDITQQKIENKELKQAKERAEESDRLKSAFLANMSHEIRTPLNGILGFTELIVDPFFDQDQKKEMAGTILENGDLLMTIINDVLDISTIEAGQLELHLSKFKIGKLISDIKVLFIPKAHKNKLNLLLNLSQRTADIELNTDFNRLKQILSNLVSNALKYTEQGSVEIGAYTKDQSLVLFVKDTGPGIEKELQEKIFERFNRSDAYTKKVGGNGLGLAISKNLVELLGGEIWVESEWQKGSCFYVRLAI